MKMALDDKTYAETSRRKIARELTLPSQEVIDKVGASTVGSEAAKRITEPISIQAATELMAFSDQDPPTETASSWNSGRQRELESLERESRQLLYEEQERLAEEAEDRSEDLRPKIYER